MIITCPSCSARFAVKAEAIGITGRKVRCAKCKHDWFQALSEESLAALEASAPVEEEPTEVSPIPGGSNLPTVAPEAATPLYMKLALACSITFFIFTLSLVSSNQILPHMGWYYSAMGVHDDTGITLYDVSVKKVTAGAEIGLLVKGRIVNESKDDKVIPNLRIAMLDAHRKRILMKMLDSEGVVLAPGDGVDLENLFENIPEGVDTVVMDIGNPVNLAAR